MNNYKLQAPYEPNGDQPEAIKKLVKGVNSGKEFPVSYTHLTLPTILPV